ncbi:hypothetical protein R1sor_004998 [Riccia sorocarpa]|uniref:Protein DETOXIFICATION n=1 Tax=Riccia sorocarpa TaxID=122646 RepID=A0ABD3HLT0_9MARC
MAPSILTQWLLKDEDNAPYLLNGSQDSEKLAASKDEDSRRWLVEELYEQFWIAGPVIPAQLFQVLIGVVTLMFIGHMGPLALSGSQIGATAAGAIGVHFVTGLAQGLETLSGQAYGAGEYRLSGVFLQRAIFVLTVFSIPISFVFWNLAPILKAMGQDPTISDVAQEYCRLQIPSLFAHAVYQPLTKFLQTQSIVQPMAVAAGISLGIHVALCNLTINHLGWGFQGVALMSGVSMWINVLLLALYVKFSPTCNKTWTGFSTEAFEDIYLFVRTALPAAFMLCLQFWCLNGLTLISGLLPNPEMETSAFAIGQQVLLVMFMIPLGLSAAVSTRVSNKLGAGLPYEARASVKVTVSVGLIDGCVNALLLLSLRNVLPGLFTSDPDVINYVSGMAPLLAIVLLLDCIGGILGGVARGCGWQRLGAYTNLVGFYGVGFPVALLLTFYFNLRAYGLWIAIICADLVQAFVLSFITLTLSWRKLADDAAELVHEAKVHLHDEDTLP